MSVNRTELVQAVAAKTGLTNTDADKALKAFQEVLVENLAAGEAVTIPGFLAVARAERGARTGINPQTGEKLEIPAGYRVKLTAVAPSSAPSRADPSSSTGPRSFGIGGPVALWWEPVSAREDVRHGGGPAPDATARRDPRPPGGRRRVPQRPAAARDAARARVQRRAGDRLPRGAEPVRARRRRRPAHPGRRVGLPPVPAAQPPPPPRVPLLRSHGSRSRRARPRRGPPRSGPRTGSTTSTTPSSWWARARPAGRPCRPEAAQSRAWREQPGERPPQGREGEDRDDPDHPAGRSAEDDVEHQHRAAGQHDREDHEPRPREPVARRDQLRLEAPPEQHAVQARGAVMRAVARTAIRTSTR